MLIQLAFFSVRFSLGARMVSQISIRMNEYEYLQHERLDQPLQVSVDLTRQRERCNKPAVDAAQKGRAGTALTRRRRCRGPLQAARSLRPASGPAARAASRQRRAHA